MKREECPRHPGEPVRNCDGCAAEIDRAEGRDESLEAPDVGQDRYEAWLDRIAP